MKASKTGTAAEIITVRPEGTVMTRQRLPNFVGISAVSAGATGLSMNLVVIPPAGAAEPHLHRGYETALYLLKGRVETRYGANLEKSVVNQPGDFVFIPAELPHQAFNLSTTEPAMAVVARNDPNEQESVRLYRPTPRRRAPSALPRLRPPKSAGTGKPGMGHTRRNAAIRSG